MTGAEPPLELPPPLQQRFDAWLEGAVGRIRPLALRDVRKGVQSLSTLYVEDRARGRLGARASGGPARRAALATYYAPLHFLTAVHAVRALPEGSLGAPSRVVDLGCGTGAAGAAVACALAATAPVLGIDRSGWALAEARHTYTAFGLRTRTRRGVLPRDLPRLRAGELAVLGWVVNEMDEGAREALVAALERALARGAALLWLEPLAGGASPWWDAVAVRLARLGAESRLVKAAVALPAWLRDLDRAARLDHRELGARVLHGPGPRA